MFGLRRSFRETALAAVAVTVGALAVIPGGPTAAAAPATAGFSASVRVQLAAIKAEKAGRTPAQRKIDSHLLIAAKRARHAAFPPGFPDLPSRVRADAAGAVRVDVHGRMTTRLLDTVRSVRGHVAGPVPQAGTLRLTVPLADVERLAASPDVSFIAPPEEPRLAVGTRTSEGDVTHRAAATRSAFGVDGTGVRVGVLSDGVDSLRASQASGDLGRVTVLSGQAGDGDEGTAMLEIVHDIAPGAQLLFATALSTPENFARNIRALRAAGADVIVDDVYYYSESTFQDGPVAQAVNDVTAAGTLFFSSAGNSGNLDDGTSGVWEGDFAAQTDGDGYVWADFDPSVDVQTVNPVAGTASSSLAVLQWADPAGASANDHDLYLLDPTGTHVLDASTDYQTGSGTAWEGLVVPASSAGGLLAVNLDTGSPRYFNLSLNGRSWGSVGGYTPFPTAGMTAGHAAAANAFGVAAAPAHHAFDVGEPAGPYPGAYGPANVVETYSSDGPRRMFFAADGTPYTPGNLTSTGGQVRLKPDLTAADGVVTTVPGFQPFFGTSAAAPHAAAIAALLLDARPAATPTQLRAALTSTAIDIEAPGRDRDSGAGIVNPPAAANYLGHRSAATNTAPASVGYYGVATIRTTLTDARTRAALGGRRITLYRRANSTAPWAAVRTVTTSATGQAAVSLRLTAGTQFRWRFAGGDPHLATNSAARTVGVKQLVSAARSAYRVRAGATVKIYGVVKPASAGRRVYLQRYANHRWSTKVGATIARQTLPNGTRTTGYVLPIRLSAAGTYWFRVYKPAATGLLAGYSATRAVRAI